MDKKKFGKVFGICISIALLAIVCFTFFVANTFNVKKNVELANINGSENTNADAKANVGETVATIKTNDGEFSIDAVEIINKASELLGEEYCQSNQKGIKRPKPMGRPCECGKCNDCG